MNPYVQQAQMLHNDPLAQWRWALSERRRNPDQQLANAEHYLWNRYYSNQGPVEALGSLITPIGYYAGKKAGLLGGRSEANLEQMGMGLLGGLHGIMD